MVSKEEGAGRLIKDISKRIGASIRMKHEVWELQNEMEILPLWSTPRALDRFTLRYSRLHSQFKLVSASIEFPLHIRRW